MSAAFLAAFVLALGGCLAAGAEWQNALRPDGKPASPVQLVKNGKSLASIHFKGEPTAPMKKAAADLQQWIQEMTGAKLGIGTGPAPRGGVVIETDATLGDEGYSIRVLQGRLVLSGGRTRGVINAVYALLEEDLGCRFYTKDSVRLPATNTLVITPVERRFTPQLRLRDPYYRVAFDPVWSLRNRANAPGAEVPEDFGGRMDYSGMFVHTAAQIVPAEKYFQEHPEYFALQANGTRSTAQLCATHPEVANIAIACVRETLQRNPHTEILSVSKNDNTEVCHCERCVRLRTDEGSDMANQLTLVNQVADAVKQSHPGLIIDTLAYLETIRVPRTMRPRPNVAIRLCNDSVGAWSRPFTPAERCDVAKLVADWGAVHNQIYIWDYNVNFSHYLAPMPNVDIMAANIQFWVKHHAQGVMLQGGYQGPAERDELKCWVMAKLLWNPAWDEVALTKDFIWGHYRQAAPVMLEYEQLLASMRKQHATLLDSPPGGIRYPMDSPFFTKEFVDGATSVFARAKELAGQDVTVKQRIERAELPILYVKCVRGPDWVGTSYPDVVASFERIARREKIQFLQEGGPDFEAKLAEYKKRIPQGTSRQPPL